MLADTKEEKLMLAQLADRQKQCEDKMYPTNSGFLSEREQALAVDYWHNRACFALWGGYREAQRRCIIFLPDYLADLQENFAADDDINPIKVLRATPTAPNAGLTHRDYLGAILALGIKRQMVGDIIVKPNGADILIMHDMAEYLSLNLTQVGHCQIETEILSCAVICEYQAPFKEISANVPSLRLDCVAAAAFGTSRSLAAEAVRGKLLAVNGLQTAKPDFITSPHDVITWRKKGKAELLSVDGKSRKDRIFITIKRYI